MGHSKNLEASEIQFFYDRDDTTLIASGSQTSGTFNSFILGLISDHGHIDRLSRTARPRDMAQMAEIIDAEHETDDDPKVA